MNRFSPRHTLFFVFGLAIVFALPFALYADHVWEDYYITYRLKQPTRHDVDGVEIASPFGSSLRNIGGNTVRLVHAPGSMVVDVPAGMNTVSGLYGFPPDAYAGDGGTDGSVFRILWTDGTQRIELSKRHLNPVNSPDDRGLQSYQLNLPRPQPKARVRLIFETEPAGPTVKDWTCWSQPTFRP